MGVARTWITTLPGVGFGVAITSTLGFESRERSRRARCVSGREVDDMVALSPTLIKVDLVEKSGDNHLD
jgi:hypothetical protein